MKELDLIKEIEERLKKEELECALFEASEAIPHDYLIVYIGADPQNRQRLLEIITQKQSIEPGVESNLFRVQFQVKLPFKIAEPCINQVSNLLSLINRFLDLPGFEMSELDNEIFYRYVLLATPESLNNDLLATVVGTTMLILELYTHPIESVATGEMSYNDLLEQTLKVTKKLTKSVT